MWLLNTTSKRLESFQESNIPRYAILSHRWETEEITYEDVIAQPPPTTKRGWDKVYQSCLIAAERGFQYIWIDTCCIDKRSSAELSEAINSMYTWYAQAEVCFAYLSDLHGYDVESFEQSLWFTRSWTLQELLAPRELIFLTSEWKNFGNKASLAVHLQQVTDIPRAALHHFDPGEWSIALRMSWASRRKATRTEDLAYSLLGVFDINMPLLYGEGLKAFQRLQEEIMRSYNDLSLFVWETNCCPRFGMLAASPSCFNLTSKPEKLLLSQGYVVNNAGLSLSLDLYPYFLGEDLQGIYIARLYDPTQILSQAETECIFLQKSVSNSLFRRVLVNGISRGAKYAKSDEKYRTCQIIINKEPVINCVPPQNPGFVINGCPAGVRIYKRTETSLHNPLGRQWNLHVEGKREDVYVTVGSQSMVKIVSSMSSNRSMYGMIGYLSWERNVDGKFLIVYFGFDFYYRPICLAFIFPGEHCYDSMVDISPQAVMDKYLTILPYDSTADMAYDHNETMYALRGTQKRMAKRDVIDLGLSIRLMPVVSARYRLSVQFNTFEPKSTELPARSIDSMTRVRRLFGFSDIPGLLTLRLNQTRDEPLPTLQ